MIEVNEYFDGKVKSLGFQAASQPASVGVMVPGEYTFNTAAKEEMSVISGSMTVLLPGESDWQDFNAGDSFKVPADSAFNLKIQEETAYLCIYG